MPDAAGNYKGQGYSAARAAGWERAFGRPGYLMSGDAVRVVDGELAGAAGTVIREDWPDRVWVLTDRGDNPLPFSADELRRC